MTPNSVKNLLTNTVNINEKPRVSISSESQGAENRNIMDTSGSNINLLARVSELLQEELLISERNEDNNKWDDVIRLLCGQLGTIKGELNNVKNHKKTLGQQKLVCILAVGLYNHIALLSYEY